jgi:hypothetical protein
VSNQGYRSPSFGNIGLGIIAFVILMGLLCTLPSAVKRVGDIFLFLPSRLGLIQRVTPDQVNKIDLTTASPAILEFPRAGKYAVYSGDTALLEANVLYGTHSVWLVIKSQATGEPIEIGSVERGLVPYDTPFADGRPIFSFEIPAPGPYEVDFSWRQASIAIVPDYVTGKESLIWLSYAAQVILLLLLAGILYLPRYLRNREIIESIKAPHRQRLAKTQSFWDAQRKKGEEKTRNRE